MTDNLHKEDFAKHLNTQFRIHFEPDISFNLELVEITEGVSNPEQEQFSLIFRGPLEKAFRQGIHRLTHEEMGELGLFLVPVDRKPDGMMYEAAFNRFIKKDEGEGQGDV
ncbi:MAG: hypothetical protein JOZ52_04540 [Acidobacteria bacterium]|nr:hypothetical protein [Acidobacteriota bacterium]